MGSNMKKVIKATAYLSVFIILTSLFGSDLLAQSNANAENVLNDTKREEVQRYFGYELLLYRYLSLPYDASINVNQVSFSYLIFTWIISTSNSFVFSPSLGKINSGAVQIDAYLSKVSFSSEPFAHLVCYMYKFSLAIYQPFYALGNAISGNSDYITYPILFAIFILISLKLLSHFSKVDHRQKYFLSFFWLYTFFWLAFSGGIVWYGNILILLGLFALTIFIKNREEEPSKKTKILRNSFVAFSIVWIILGSTVRISNILPYQAEKDLGTGIYNPIFYEYATGKMTKAESLGAIYNDIDKAINRINQDKKSKVWKVGTTFSYFINNNNKRLISDNQLGEFKTIRDRFKDNTDLLNFFRVNNIKFILVDLNTQFIDNTPNKSLTKKFAELIYLVYNNPNMKLLATDRVVGNRKPNGEIVYTRNIHGEIIHIPGRFAIYEIN